VEVCTYIGKTISDLPCWLFFFETYFSSFSYKSSTKGWS